MEDVGQTGEQRSYIPEDNGGRAWNTRPPDAVLVVATPASAEALAASSGARNHTGSHQRKTHHAATG